jgi:hypothetical protein
MMVSIVAFEKPCSGAQTLGLGHSKDFEKKLISKTLEWEAIPLKDFKNEF